MQSSSHQGHQGNRLLAALPDELLQLLGRDLRQVSIPGGKSIFEPGAPIEEIYFPQNGMISLMVVNKDGRPVEISTVGREGAVGIHGALGTRSSFTRAITQLGGNFTMVRASALGRLAREHTKVRDLVTHYIEIVLAETQQIAACNAVHLAPARLCRWLLQSADHIGSDDLELTQELLAEMVNVRRTTVTILAQSLQHAGAIKYSRGRIRILDRDHLRRCACECYSAIQHERLSLKIGTKF